LTSRAGFLCQLAHLFSGPRLNVDLSRRFQEIIDGLMHQRDIGLIATIGEKVAERQECDLNRKLRFAVPIVTGGAYQGRRLGIILCGAFEGDIEKARALCGCEPLTGLAAGLDQVL
jgi:hypothetical protein